MKHIWGFAAATALVASGMPAAPARADTRANNAKDACTYRVRSAYGASTRNVSASERGYDRYNVSGQAQRNGETASFTCQTDGGSVRSLNVGSWKRGGGGGDTLAAVGIAVGLAAIIAAASSKKKNDDYDRYGQQDYYRNNNGYNNYNNYNRYPQYNSDVFSPSGGISCYRAQRACFDKYNNYNVRWTQREFNY